MADRLSIANRSLLQIGARSQISSFSPSDGSTEADAVSVLYLPTFEQLGRAARWNCLRKQTTLALQAAAQGTQENPSGTPPLPPTPFLYQYAYPQDCLSMRYIVPSLPSAAAGSVPPTTINNAAATWLPGDNQIPFAVAYAEDADGNPINCILTNQSQAQAVYTVNQPNPVIWDSMFQQAMVNALAAFLVPALSLNLSLMQVAISGAERLIGAARTADGNEGVTVMDHVPDWIRARGGENGWSWDRAAWQYGGYVNVSWPGP